MSKNNVVTLRGPEDGDLGPEIQVDAETGEILDEEGNSTGKTLSDLTDEYVPPFRVTGSQPQLSFEVEVPEHRLVGSVLKLKAGKLPLTGQFRYGDRVRLVIEVEVESVDFKPVRVGGEIFGIDRVHTATVEAATTETG